MERQLSEYDSILIKQGILPWKKIVVYMCEKAYFHITKQHFNQITTNLKYSDTSVASKIYN